MTKYLCWSCGKAAKPTKDHDPNSTEVHYLADCCRYPQPEQMELL